VSTRKKKKLVRASKVKSKSTMRGRTKTLPTRTTDSRRSTSKTFKRVSIGQHVYSVPQEIWLKLVTELEPHKIEEEKDLMSFEEFFEENQEDTPEWAAFLRGLRYRENLTQAAFAAAIGITQSNLSAMENGKRAIGKELAKHIADTFNTNYRYFL
jgi:DNA-binding XRE family transcriptional regulator